MSEDLCPFCDSQLGDRILLQNDTFLFVYDLYPVSPGHILLIPKRHISTFFNITIEELNDFYSLIHLAHSMVEQKFSPDGYNIGINDGTAAGQTISHLHIHLIPRYYGDDQNPEGGIRKIMPNIVNYPRDI